jgi:hypothetical protein
MGIDYEVLLQNPKVRLALGRRRFMKAAQDADFFSDLLSKEGKPILSVENSDGANWISEWEQLYFVTSTEYEAEGPFVTLKEALSDERFSLQISEPEICSKVLPMAALLEIGKAVASEGEAVFINGTRYVLRDGSLVEEEEYESR